MRDHVRLLFGLIAIALAIPGAAEEGKVGIVLLHGKQSPVPGPVGSLAQKLRGAHYLVAIPEMPWSRNRIYGASYEDAMSEIDRAADGLRKKGAQKIVVGGHGLGGNAAVGCAARRGDLAGIFVLAPSQSPELSRWREMSASSVAHAREMVAAGHGESFESFTDSNMGKIFYPQASAKSYLSYFDPDGPAVIPKNATAIRSAIAILWVVGTKDLGTPPSGYAFDKAPPHPKSKYVAVDSEYLQVPAVAAEQVLAWLRSLDH